MAAIATLSLATLPTPAMAQGGTDCVVTFRTDDNRLVSNIDFEVSYAAAGGTFDGAGSTVVCGRAVPDSFVAFNNREDDRKLGGAIIRADPFRGPTDIAGCRFLYFNSPPSPGNFAINVTNAGRGGQDGNVTPYPEMYVSRVECPGELPTGVVATTTTTSTSTSTSLPPTRPCGFPATLGVRPSATDALFALKAAVGQVNCRLCVCDVDNSGAVVTTDSLIILRVAVGHGELLVCPDCF